MTKANENRSPSAIAWQRFKKNKPAVFGLVIIALAIGVATLGALLRPDPSANANNQQLSLAKKEIGFEVLTLKVRKNKISSEAKFWQLFLFGGREAKYDLIPIHSYTFSKDSILGFKYGGSADVTGEPFRFHLLNVVHALSSDISENARGEFESSDMNNISVSDKSSALKSIIEREHLFQQRFLLGTDKFGRDMLSRLMAGTVISLSVGLISVFISLLLGIGLGAMAGYYGGFIDDFITWIINVVWSIPTLLLVIAITFALGKGFVQVFVAVGLTMWVEVARVVRGQVLSLKSLEYIEAARALGYGPVRILGRHVIPNIMGPVIVISAANFASAILLEAGLSFLGIGAQIPMASWGQMIKEHYAYITTDLAFLAILPGLCILILVLAFMLIGSGLRDSLDTKATA